MGEWISSDLVYIELINTERQTERNRDGDIVRENKTKVVQGMRQKYSPILKSIHDFCYFCWSSLSLSACRKCWLSFQILSLCGRLCSVIIFGCLNTKEPLLLERVERNHSFHLRPHFEIYFFLPYCMEISPPLIFSIYSDVTAQANVGWTSKSWGCSFLTTALVSTFLPAQKHQGDKKKRFTSSHKNDHIGADCREDFKTHLSQLMIRQTGVQG